MMRLSKHHRMTNVKMLFVGMAIAMLFGIARANDNGIQITTQIDKIGNVIDLMAFDTGGLATNTAGRSMIEGSKPTAVNSADVGTRLLMMNTARRSDMTKTNAGAGDASTHLAIASPTHNPLMSAQPSGVSGVHQSTYWTTGRDTARSTLTCYHDGLATNANSTSLGDTTVNRCGLVNALDVLE